MILTYASLAQAQGTGLFGAGAAGLVFDFIAIGAIIYFLLIRGPQKERQKHELMVGALKKGDEVVTAGGIVGKVIFIKEMAKDGTPAQALLDRITIESGESRIIVERGKIHRVGGASAAGPST